MLAYSARLIVFASVLLSSFPLSAGCPDDFLSSIARDTKRRNCWPQPFDCPDRQTVRMPFAIMVNNGWRRQNMLGDYHFDPKTGQLTEAGQMKIHWILFEAPQQHRDIYVHIGQTPEETSARLANVRTQVASLVPQGEMPPIMQTSIPDAGSPADRVELIDRKYQTSIPIPRLPALTGGNGGGNSSNGSSGM
jgi:hypothetical protein